MATDTALQETDMRATVSRFHQTLLFYLSARGTHVAGETPRVGTRNLRLNFRPSRGFLNDLRRSTRIVMENAPERKLPSISVINAEVPGQISVRSSYTSFLRRLVETCRSRLGI